VLVLYSTLSFGSHPSSSTAGMSCSCLVSMVYLSPSLLPCQVCVFVFTKLVSFSFLDLNSCSCLRDLRAGDTVGCKPQAR
jgi:hypothetical protein